MPLYSHIVRHILLWTGSRVRATTDLWSKERFQHTLTTLTRQAAIVAYQKRAMRLLNVAEIIGDTCQKLIDYRRHRASRQAVKGFTTRSEGQPSALRKTNPAAFHHICTGHRPLEPLRECLRKWLCRLHHQTGTAGSHTNYLQYVLVSHCRPHQSCRISVPRHGYSMECRRRCHRCPQDCLRRRYLRRREPLQVVIRWQDHFHINQRTCRALH